MAIVKAKPTSPGRRFVVKVVNEDLHKGAPYEPLLEAKSKTAASPPAIKAVVTSKSIVASTFVGTRTVSPV